MKGKQEILIMKKNLFIVWGSILLAACGTTRDLATSEYDDVYYTSKDRTEILDDAIASSDNEANTDRNSYNSAEYGTEEDYTGYGEDDFYFSRRIRRFEQSNDNSWRYYDPFFSNDLYYVMGTSYWDRWNGNGWYSWTRPRFGSAVSLSFGDPFYRPFRNLYDPFGYNSLGYYNPWVSSYYGFDPFYSYGSWGTFGGGYGYYTNYLGGYYNNVWCPTPITNANGWRAYNVTRRPSFSSITSQDRYQPVLNNTTQGRDPSTNSVTPRTRTGLPTRTANPDVYLRPKTEEEKNARLSPSEIRRPSTQNIPSRTQRPIELNNGSNDMRNRRTSEGYNTSGNRQPTTVTPSQPMRRPTQVQSQGTTPNNSAPIRRPSSGNEGSTIQRRPSGDNSGSFNRPSTSTQGSFDRPSSNNNSSSPARTGTGSSSGSGGSTPVRRPNN